MKILKQVCLLMLVLSAQGARADAAAETLKSSMVEKNAVTLERVERDAIQVFCSKPRSVVGDPDEAAALREAALSAVTLPGDDDFLGDWRKGLEVASNGRGLQYTDDPAQANGGNCYACHQLDPEEMAYGTLGPSLSGYGARGRGLPMLQYTWTKLWNTHAYNTCSHMPRFGAAGILTQQQLKDVMAFLLDPESPVNRGLVP